MSNASRQKKNQKGKGEERLNPLSSLLPFYFSLKLVSAGGVACVNKFFDAPARLRLIQYELSLLVNHVVGLVVKSPRIAAEKKEDVAKAGVNGGFAGLKN